MVSGKCVYVLKCLQYGLPAIAPDVSGQAGRFRYYVVMES
jgi:hypothetical protein